MNASFQRVNNVLRILYLRLVNIFLYQT